MPFGRVGDNGMNYWIGREGLSTRKETILFIHGAGGGLLSWNCQKAFFEKEFKPIMIELPGHGTSGGKGEEEIERYAEHVYSFIKALGLSEVFLAGHSMGGAIAQTLALTRPEILKGIVLVGTGARLKVLPAVLDGIKNNFEETVQKITRFAFSRKASSDLIQAGIEQLMKCRPDVLYGDFLACDRFDRMAEVAKIDLPTLIVCGDEDEMTPVKYSELLHSRIKGSKLEIIPHAGHMVMMESPELFNEKVGEFIGETTQLRIAPACGRQGMRN
jgi:pimeloyl-ACP methyl ester carboxylesterase